MSYERLTRLPEYLDKHGVTWTGLDGWETYAAAGPDTREYTPAGLVNHHTAGTDWYPPDRLKNKCNMFIDPSGLVYIISLGYQYDTGYGDPNVLMRVRNDQEPQPPQDNTVADRILMNQWFVDVEVGHWGDGSPIPERQRDALILVNVAVMDMMGWDPRFRLLGHKEVTRRKIDPRWSWQGWPDGMDRIREDTLRLLVERTVMPKEQFANMVNALFAGRPDLFKGDPAYFYTRSPEGIYDDPVSEDWVNFWNCFTRAISGN